VATSVPTTVASTSTEPTTTTTTTAPATTTTAPATTAPPDLAAKARAAVLLKADFPAGFEPVPEADGGGLNIEKLWGELGGCLGVAPAQPASTASSPNFLRGLATQARTTVEYMPEASSAALAKALGGPKLQGCATNAFAADVKRSAPEGGVPGPVTVAPLNAPPVAPKSFAYRITVEVSLDELKCDRGDRSPGARRCREEADVAGVPVGAAPHRGHIRVRRALDEGGDQRPEREGHRQGGHPATRDGTRLRHVFPHWHHAAMRCRNQQPQPNHRR